MSTAIKGMVDDDGGMHIVPTVGGCELEARYQGDNIMLTDQRGQTINGQISRMREGAPVAIAHATRLAAQDAAIDAFVRAAVLTPTDGDVWNDLKSDFMKQHFY